MTRFDILPRINDSVVIGGDKDRSRILVARSAERGREKFPIYFDASDDFVVLEVGKRGSGKSYGMGSVLEGFATGEGSRIAYHKDPRAVILLDPLDIHWPALISLRPDGTEALRRQHELLHAWPGLEAEPINVQVFVPAGYEWPMDYPGFHEYRIPVSAMSADDWALLLSTDLIAEPRGRLLDEAHRKVTVLGWQKAPNSGFVEPHSDYSVNDLIGCIDQDHEIQALYADGTRRSVIQPLRTYARMPLFADTTGTPMVEVAKCGVLSILCLGRLPEDLRTVVSTVFVRKLKADRMAASTLKRRLALSDDDVRTQAALRQELEGHVPRTILAIDEAQILMPSRERSIARKALDSYVLEGRNFGLSLWLATQRPKGAISDRAVSQIDTFFVHRLSVADDIKAVCGMFQNRPPDKVRLRGEDLDLGDLIRSLSVGEAVLSSATSSATRLVVGEIRPRMVAHGGEAF